eukprot:TRINITY_DN23831_c0_g1_i2.p1 TRINITY_DN23831_c0_g1~~TRINITY_DN23831_c0_g1_i2.p1  ORF type:complete len:102 (+),score=20.38 TRINITY_DN23831_c0_g1_i2:28-333(+)
MKLFTAAEVAEHKTPADLWVIIDKKVYDLTSWHQFHPGGPELLLRYGGLDVTAAEKTAHGTLKKPISIMHKYCIGSADSLASSSCIGHSGRPRKQGEARNP